MSGLCPAGPEWPDCMADVILLGEAAAHGTTMLEIRCGRCDRYGRLTVKRLLAEWGTMHRSVT